MAARAIWKGVVGLGDGVPVKLYSAVEERRIHFRLLHEKDLVPVRREMVNPEKDEPVPREARKRGWETDDGKMVILDDEDLEALEPDHSREIQVLRFVEPAQLPHPWYDRPYYLGPDGDEPGWSALAAGLERTGLEGIVRWVMRKRRYVGALRPHAGLPMLVTLRGADEVIEASDVEAPDGRDLDEKELDMARKLVEMLAGDFDPSEWEDAHRARMVELIEAKAEGKTVSLGEARKRRKGGESLTKALEASLKAARGRKSA